MKRVFISELLAPALLFFIINHFVFLTAPVMRVLDRYRPLGSEIDLNTGFQKYLFHAEANTWISDRAERVVFVGSSSVVFAIDAELIEKIFIREGIALYPLNYGMIGLNALELPMLKKYFFDNKIKVVVLLYNTFSFPRDSPPPEIVTRWNAIRWDTVEFLRTIRAGKRYAYLYAYRNMLASGLASDLFPIAKYNLLLRSYMRRFCSGTIHQYRYDLDSFSQKPAPLSRPRIFEKPLGADDLGRKAFLDSDTDDDTLGYRCFTRFLDIAQEKNIKVIVAPFPEPEFASYGKYRQGINVRRIDEHVRKIVEKKNMLYLSRDEAAAIAKTDRYYHDDQHMSREGQKEYSAWLAHKVAAVLRRGY